MAKQNDSEKIHPEKPEINGAELGKKFFIELDEDQAVQLGLIFDHVLRLTGVQHIDAIYEMRLQIKSQMPEPARPHIFAYENSPFNLATGLPGRIPTPNK